MQLESAEAVLAARGTAENHLFSCFAHSTGMQTCLFVVNFRMHASIEDGKWIASSNSACLLGFVVQLYSQLSNFLGWPQEVVNMFSIS